MKFKDLSIPIIIVIISIVTAVGIISTHFLGPDNPVEEVAEEIIKEETGLNIDLSPKSAESPKP